MPIDLLWMPGCHSCLYLRRQYGHTYIGDDSKIKIDKNKFNLIEKFYSLISEA